MLWVIQETEMGNAAVAMKSMVGVANGKSNEDNKKRPASSAGTLVIEGERKERGRL